MSSDEQIRELERRAGEGDEEAQAQLERERVRSASGGPAALVGRIVGVWLPDDDNHKVGLLENVYNFAGQVWLTIIQGDGKVDHVNASAVIQIREVQPTDPSQGQRLIWPGWPYPPAAPFIVPPGPVPWDPSQTGHPPPPPGVYQVAGENTTACWACEGTGLLKTGLLNGSPCYYCGAYDPPLDEDEDPGNTGDFDPETDLPF